jgi:hypothetical protein
VSAKGALAQAPADPLEQAKKFFEAGKQAYEAGQYMLASTAFEASYRLSPRPPILFSMAQAYRRQYVVDRDPSRLRRAVDLYRQYIAEVPQGGRREDAVQYVSDLEPLLLRAEEEQKKLGSSALSTAPVPVAESTQIMVSSRTRGARATIDGGNAGEVPVIREVTAGRHTIHVEAAGYAAEDIEGVAVEGRLIVVEVNLRELPARLQLATEAGAELSVDGRPVGRTPFGEPVLLPHGKHLVVLAKRGHYAVSREVSLVRGQEVVVSSALETTTQRVASYYVLGGAGLLLVGGMAASVTALVAQGDAQDILDKRDVERQHLSQGEVDEYTAERDRRDQYRGVSKALYGGAFLVGLSGALLYYVDTPRVELPSAALLPVVSRDGVGATLAGTF